MVLKALIAARSGSIRVENKNIRPFAGSSLLEVKIRQLQRIPALDGVVVNSNDEEILSLAASLGCETVLRDPYYASNTVSMSEVYKNMAEQMDCDIILYANCTNPLIEDDTFTRAIRAYIEGEARFDSLNSAHLIKEFLFKDNLPINYDLRHQPRSQDLPDIAALNFAINILRKEVMIDCKNVVGYRPQLFIIDQTEATDVDNPIDFDFSDFVFRRREAERKNC